MICILSLQNNFFFASFRRVRTRDFSFRRSSAEGPSPGPRGSGLSAARLHVEDDQLARSVAAIGAAVGEDGRGPGLRLENLLLEGGLVARRRRRADLQYQLGLALIRQGRKADALPLLKAAAESGNSHYAYVYGVALFDGGQGALAVTTLRKALAATPDDRELLYGLASIAAAAGQREVALGAARRLAALDPGNEEVQRFLAQLEGGAGPPP